VRVARGAEDHHHTYGVLRLVHSADIKRSEHTHEVIYLCASWYLLVVLEVEAVVAVVEDDSDTSPSPSESEPSPKTPDTTPIGNTIAPLAASEAIGGGAPSIAREALFNFGVTAAEEPSGFVVFVFATGDEGMTTLLPLVVETWEGEEDEEPFTFFAFFRLFRGDVGVACAGSAGRLGSAGTAAFRPAPEWRPFFSGLAGAVPADVGDRSALTRRGCEAALSERAASSSATVSTAVGDADTSRSVVAATADAALVFMRGTSTKSAVSDRGEFGGEGEENAAEDDKDQTIWSSSEGESLADLVLSEVRESTSIEDDKDVVMASWYEEEKRKVYWIKGSVNYYRQTRLSDPPIHHAISVTRNHNLFNVDISPPDPPVRITHDLRPSLP
jgi:hypothetical protein